MTQLPRSGYLGGQKMRLGGGDGFFTFIKDGYGNKIQISLNVGDLGFRKGVRMRGGTKTDVKPRGKEITLFVTGG